MEDASFNRSTQQEALQVIAMAVMVNQSDLRLEMERYRIQSHKKSIPNDFQKKWQDSNMQCVKSSSYGW